MSDNLQPESNFGIQDTMDMGAGDAQLLNDLMAPETAQADPEAVVPIVKEAEDKAPEATDPKGKELTKPASPDGKTEEEKKSGESIINDFLSNDPDAEEEASRSICPSGCFGSHLHTGERDGTAVARSRPG